VFGDAAKESDDPFVRYLAFFFTGQALETIHRSHEAEAAYRQALTVILHVQSGVEALAALLFLDGKPDESYAIVQASFEAQPRPPDVWRLYGFGDFVRWPDLIARLRVELQ
jgi:predicted Zn-dependent protease